MGGALTGSMFECPFKIKHGVVAMQGREREKVRTLFWPPQFHEHTDIFLQEHSSVGEHRLCRNGSACAWPAPCGQCWYDDDWNFLSELLLAHTDLSGLPRNLWKVPQTFGRAGRDKKLQAVGVQMYWPGQKGLFIWIFYWFGCTFFTVEATYCM